MGDRVVIIDYGVGNVGSIQNVLDRIGADAVVSADPEVVKSAGKLILPGVGAFDNGARRLEATGLVPLLRERVEDDRVPILGICLGMQLFAHRSDEGAMPGLGWIDGEVVRFDFRDAYAPMRVPFIGWSSVERCRPSRILQAVPDGAEFYFLHSYHLRSSSDEVAGETRYGYPFASVVERDNIVGVQFHPEKSQRAGMAVFRNFLQRF